MAEWATSTDVPVHCIVSWCIIKQAQFFPTTRKSYRYSGDNRGIRFAHFSAGFTPRASSPQNEARSSQTDIPAQYTHRHTHTHTQHRDTEPQIHARPFLINLNLSVHRTPLWFRHQQKKQICASVWTVCLSHSSAICPPVCLWHSPSSPRDDLWMKN